MPVIQRVPLLINEMIALIACGGATPVPATAPEPTSVFTPLVASFTPTPLPPPSTPTTESSPTSASTQQGAAPSPADSISAQMVEIPAGPFTLGSDADGPDSKPAQSRCPSFSNRHVLGDEC